MESKPNPIKTLTITKIKTKLYTTVHSCVTEQVNDVHRVYEYVIYKQGTAIPVRLLGLCQF
jgi:hypothetical protein